MNEETIEAYWAEVRRLLHSDHELSSDAASRAVRIYRETLTGLGEMIYHSPAEEMARGIITGEYANQEGQ